MCPEESADLNPGFFQRMVETVGVGVGIYGEDGEYIYVNEAYADLFSVSPAELIGAPIWKVAPEIEQKRYHRYWDSFETGETRTAETVHEYRGVSVPVVTVTTRRMIDGVAYHFGTVKDISERKTREREIERQNKRLDKFASVVSHDLRNPLNVASVRLSLLAEECDSAHLASIDRAHTRMEVLIDDLLTLAREGDAVTESEPIDVATLADQCWETVQTSEATLVTDAECVIRADRSRLRQVFENLFRNAIEHGGETVSITVGELEEGFYVEDDGPGIPPADRKDVFETGYSTSEEGTGFGLSIVKQVVDAHDWMISVTEGSEGGARFEITGVECIAE